MSVSVFPADPLSPLARMLLAQSQAHMASLYAEEENFALSTEALANPAVTFLLATADNEPAGCAALKSHGDWAEVKSMFVAPVHRRKGIGTALMKGLEAAAHSHGIRLLRLETGHDLQEAVTLYRRHGFVERGPFGDYPDGPASLFMERPL